MNKNALNRVPLIAIAALPLTLGLVFAQQTGTQTSGAQTSGTQAAKPERVQPLQPGQRNQNNQNSQNNQRNQNQGDRQGRQQSGTNYGDVFLQKLAAQLGLSVDKLRAAAVAAGKSTVDQGVKAGDFPADMAQNATQMLQDNPFALAHGPRGMRGGPEGGRHGGHDGGRGGDHDDDARGGDSRGSDSRGGPMVGQMNGQMGGRDGKTGGMRGSMQAVNAAVARALGLTEAQLMTELQGGKTVAQLAQAKGVSTAALHTAAVNALKTQLDAAVKAGQLGQAQADQMLKQAQDDPNFGLNFGGRGRGGMRGQDGTDQSDTQASGISG